MKSSTTKTYTTRDGAFNYGFVAKAGDMAGRMFPSFRPHWWAQRLSDGDSEIFDTRAQCRAWMKSFYVTEYDD